ncbi:peptidase [Methylobacterium brachythecii]|uniref:Peptidase n=2 Tax=Methylobacterium brachythecii TaxID=1176177 RepID=A0ABQ6CVL2_9HYPH|nr:peptidase [Methylobacterium brachythecii]
MAMSVAAPSTGAIALHADRSGHFTTSALVNGRTVSMLVDTGATNCAFREEEAESLGIRIGPNDFTRVVGTANGTVRVAPVRIRLLQIGPVAVRDVEAAVIPRGLLGTNLLGMSFLSRLREFNVAKGRITLRG